MLEYKGYIGKVDFDDEVEIFHGEVLNLRDIITFQGRSVTELRKAFKDSINDYLEFCAERHEDPEKPLSGNFTLRLDPELHRKIYLKARISNKSLNSLVTEILMSTLDKESGPPLYSKKKHRITKR